MAMIAITTNSSISVKPLRIVYLPRDGVWYAIFSFAVGLPGSFFAGALLRL
jgi:hypothetical protein